MGKIVNGVANDYDCEQYEDWNKHLKYCQSNDPIILTRWQDPTIEEYQKEIARLNKIIDELEKWLWKELESHNYSSIKLKPLKSGNTIRVVSITRLMEVLDKLKELKEEGK